MFAVGLSCARALDEAHHAGYAFEESGKNGPFVGGVGVRERGLAAGAKKGARFEVKLTVRARGYISGVSRVYHGYISRVSRCISVYLAPGELRAWARGACTIPT